MTHPREKTSLLKQYTRFKITAWQRRMEALCVTGREEESCGEVIVKCQNVLRKVFQVESRIF